MSDCEHRMSDWRPVPGTTDCLMRRCERCGARDFRILPPDVRPGDVRRERGWWQWEEQE